MQSSPDKVIKDAVQMLSQKRARRNVVILSACQALFMTVGALVIINSALAGQALLGSDKSLATLPLSLQFVGTMIATIPASLFMRGFGRRNGFILGAIIGIFGAAITILAIWHTMFWLMCIGGVCIGMSMGFGHYYRFAAADTADEAYRAKAISLVVSGGVISALFGPSLARETVDLFEPIMFAGCYGIIIILQLLSIGLLTFIEIPPSPVQESQDTGRPILKIAQQPVFLIAVGGASLGYAIMALLMTATPLAMHGHGFDYGDTSWVIQFHALAMFAPSFFTGFWINRFGVLHVMLVGTLLMLICCAVHLIGVDFGHFWLGLILLGLGWNFLFVGGSTLLTETYRAPEKAKIQAINDFLVFGSTALASLSAGILQAGLGWKIVNLVMIFPVLLILLALIWSIWQRYHNRTTGVQV